MAKKCKAPDCDRDVFSHDYCLAHNYLRTDSKWLKSLLKQHKRGNTRPTIRKVSEKQSKKLQQYEKAKKKKEQELKKANEWRCIFCGKYFGDDDNPDFHHLAGRIGDLIADKKYLYPAHTKCHIEDYHQATVEHIKTMFWYEEFLERIKLIDIDLWNKEKRKEDKSI